MKKTAFVFPGQGSQSVKMLAELAQQFPIIQETFAEASEALNYDLWQLTQAGPAEILNQTEKTQPALLAGGIAVWRLWQQQNGAKPSLLAGHSLGEYTALVCANALDFKTAIKLVEMRGQFMQAAVPAGEGAMAAIVGLEDSVVANLCKDASLDNQIVTPANFNSLSQVVVAGNKQAVERVVAAAKPAGAKLATLLPVSVPSHCSLMKPAAEKLKIELEKIEIKTPEIEIINNADVCSYQNPAEIKAALIKQLYSPVRWVETIQLFEKSGIALAIECGPGKVLTGLNKRITEKFNTLSTHTPEQLAQALT